jgi:hypothetical protein
MPGLVFSYRWEPVREDLLLRQGLGCDHPLDRDSTAGGAGAQVRARPGTCAQRSNRLRPAGWTSADAAGLPILPGLARYDEVARRQIDAGRTASCTPFTASPAPVRGRRFDLAAPLVPVQVMLPRFWVASTKPEAALVRSQGSSSLGKDEGGIWRRVIAGQK